MVGRRKAAGAEAQLAADAKADKGGPIKSWSFSRLTTYRLCPRKARFLYVDKLKEPGNPAGDEGTRIHKQAELYLKKAVLKLAPELKLFAQEFEALLKDARFLRIEAELAYRADWSPTRWNDWTGAWVRIKMDCMHAKNGVAKVIDYKTGKEKPEDLEQQDLYAIAAFLEEPTVNEVHVELWYTKTGDILGTEPDKPYTRDMLPGLLKKWTKMPQKMLNDHTFEITPNKLCDWCFFGQAGKAKGGPGLCPK